MNRIAHSAFVFLLTMKPLGVYRFNGPSKAPSRNVKIVATVPSGSSL